MPDITVIILTRDEEIHIERCIRSVQRVCREVVVVDSYSTDRTRRLAEAMGARVVCHPFVNQSSQFNWALDHLEISTEWIWRVDADEIIDERLIRLAKTELSTPRYARMADADRQINGIYVNKRIIFMGRALEHGGWYPAPQIKLVRRGFGRCEERIMDEHLIISSGCATHWQGDQTDWNLKSLDWWWKKHLGYAVREAEQQLHDRMSAETAMGVQGRLLGTNVEFKRWMRGLYNRCPRYLRAVVYFLSRYILMGGFLDGYAGWYWHTRQGLRYRWIVDQEIGRRLSHYKDVKR